MSDRWTWGQFKARMEELGMKDESTMWFEGHDLNSIERGYHVLFSGRVSNVIYATDSGDGIAGDLGEPLALLNISPEFEYSDE